ncbi:hypothetical protein GE061_003889 [Apolygus lucorum]|uniref:Ninjurin-1 n=1 Tax=Apolygus lucorum TaxID=248454 RepID=A0A8S9WZE9_APOLU|nr:hypothetical protein GE061_003889 [Apolygus lucorum]
MPGSDGRVRVVIAPSFSRKPQETLVGGSFVAQSSRMADEESVSVKRPGVQYSTYAAKKTVAQGMMDIALITANANQLRYLIEFQSNSPTFYVTLVLIIVSIVLQLTVGIFLIFKGRYDLKGQEKLEAANTINNFVVVGVFLVTVINVFIASFSITGDPSVPLKGPITGGTP